LWPKEKRGGKKGKLSSKQRCFRGGTMKTCGFGRGDCWIGTEVGGEKAPPKSPPDNRSWAGYPGKNKPTIPQEHAAGDRHVTEWREKRRGELFEERKSLFDGAMRGRRRESRGEGERERNQFQGMLETKISAGHKQMHRGPQEEGAKLRTGQGPAARSLPYI